MVTVEAEREPAMPDRAGRHELGWAVWSVVAAFGTYFCMYGFRKPFTAAAFEGADGGAGFKTILVTSQVAGYMVSKFIGIKVIAELKPQQRAAALLAAIGAAEAALVLFAIVPPPWNAVCLFANGLPLGMIFGMIIGFLEGRKLTEALTAGLCASFILADGVTKSVGTWLLERGISEFWMPAAAGLVFLLPLVGFVAMLARIPPPSPSDVASRAARATMSRSDRRALCARYAPGLTLLVAMYLLVTILRSIRADFAPEIWKGLGWKIDANLFWTTELLVALGVLAVNGCGVLIRDNRRAFFASLATCTSGFVMAIVALAGLRSGWLNGFAFMVLIGLGLYLPYVAVHTTIFERLLAMTRDRGNLGFLMYLADAFGYLGYVAVMLGHTWLGENELTGSGNFLVFFSRASWLAVIGSTLCVAGAAWYFAARRSSAPVVAATEASG